MAIALALGSTSVLAGCSSDKGGSEEVQLSAAGERGKQVAKEQGCISCHTADGSKSTGPTWKGLAGSEVELEDGTTVVADDAYLTQSILAPRTVVVDGYANIMPVYEGEVSPAELADLLAYLQDLAPSDATGSDAPADGS